MARRPGKYQGAGLRAFRSRVAIAKRKGLLSLQVDARKQRPTSYMRKKIARLADAGIFIPKGQAGHTEPAFVKSTQLRRAFAKSGWVVSNKRVIAAPQVARKLRRSKGKGFDISEDGYLLENEIVGQHSDTMITKVFLPASVRNWDSFFIRLRAGEFDKYKRPQDVFAFTFMGGKSRKTFKNSEKLADWLQYYKSIEDYPGMTWEHFILYKVYPPGAWEELGDGLTYVVPRKRRGKRDKRGNYLTIGGRAKLTMAEVKARASARKKAANAKPEKKAQHADYMRSYRADKAKEEGRKLRPYKRRK